MSSNYYKKMAKELGLKILYSDKLDELLDELNELDEFGIEASDATIVCDTDEGWLSAVLITMSVCLKHPNQKTWVIGFSEDDGGYALMHIFVSDDVQSVMEKIKDSIKESKKLKRKAKVA